MTSINVANNPLGSYPVKITEEVLPGGQKEFIQHVNVDSIEVLPVPTALSPGRKTIAVTNTAVQLVAVSTPCTKVDIKAFSANVNDIVIGDSSIVYTLGFRTGFFISSGESYHIEIDDVSKIYINGAINEGVTFTYYT